MKISIPVIDLFAGPGGLGEGFSSLRWNKFKIALSIEKDPVAHRTLRLRSFYRQFKGRIPDEFYEVLKGKLSDEELFAKKNRFSDRIKKALNNAEAEANCLTLGEEPIDSIDNLIHSAINNNKNWILIGGPPCQAYSLAGRSRNKGIKDYKPEKDHRHYLYKEYLRVIAEHRPSVFIMENVKGILSSSIKGELIFQQMLKDLSNPCEAVGKKKSGRGYRIHSICSDSIRQTFLPDVEQMDPCNFIIRCEDYGIPQARHRVILVGIREDLWKYELGKLRKSEEKVTVKDVLKDLPVLRSGLSKHEDSEQLWKKLIKENTSNTWFKKEISKVVKEQVHIKMDRGNEFIPESKYIRWIPRSRMKKYLSDWYKDSRLQGICNSSTRAHIYEDIKRYFYASMYASEKGRSPGLRDFPDELMPAHRNAKSGHFNDRFRVQVADLPSTTITSHISKDGHYYIHPDPKQCRSLTVREAARLQTFPDNYFFCGNRTQQYTQVGNAVPPLLAKQIAEIVYRFLNKAGCI